MFAKEYHSTCRNDSKGTQYWISWSIYGLPNKQYSFSKMLKSELNTTLNPVRNSIGIVNLNE